MARARQAAIQAAKAAAAQPTTQSPRRPDEGRPAGGTRTPSTGTPSTPGTGATGSRPAAGSDWGTLDDWNLDPATRARMEAHLAGGGILGQWQLGARPPNYEQWSQMSQTERNLLGLPTTWELHLAGDAHLNWINGRGAWEGLGRRWNPGNQYDVGGRLGWSSVPDISWDTAPTEFNYTNPSVPDWISSSQRPNAPEYVPNGPYDAGGSGAPAATPAPSTPSTPTPSPAPSPAPGSDFTRYRGPLPSVPAPQEASPYGGYSGLSLSDLGSPITQSMQPTQPEGLSLANLASTRNPYGSYRWR